MNPFEKTPGLHEVQMGIGVSRHKWLRWKRRYHWVVTYDGLPFKGVAPTEYEAFERLIEKLVDLELPDMVIQMAMAQQMKVWDGARERA